MYRIEETILLSWQQRELKISGKGSKMEEGIAIMFKYTCKSVINANGYQIHQLGQATKSVTQ